MNLHTRFAVNAPNVVCEVFDQEVVVVNLDVGIYYSIGGWAAQIWLMLQNHYCAQEIIQSLQPFCKEDSTSIENTVAPYIQDLLDKGLIVVDSTTFEPTTHALILTAVDSIPALGLEEFSDMQDMLLLDPVHDVDEAGWPIAKPPQ